MTAKTHSLMPTFKEQLDRGQIGRREFMRFSALLGLSAGAACAFAGIAPPAHAADNSAFPAPDANAKTGGIVRIGHSVAKMDDPATYSWNEMVNQTRPILECMFALGPDNIIKPLLVESWEPSSDLKTWTFHLRKGVMWHNGEELTAEHIAWNVKRWTDSATASSNIGLSTFAALTQVAETGADGKPVMKLMDKGVEVIDSHTLRFNLTASVLSVPEDCAEKTTMILHPSFTSPFSDKPVGTGPFTLGELKVGDRCILKQVKTTTDGKPFSYWGGTTYLDEIHFYNFESENQPAALSDGSIDIASELTIDQIEFAKALETATVLSVETANTLCLRMQVDQKPFDDIRVRQAIVKAADNAAIRSLIFPEGGSVGYNFHVGPAHPEYFALPELERDVEGAKALLAEAGHGDGLDITITTGNTDGPWHQAVCEALRDQLKEAGINLSIDVLPSTKFWEVWDKVPFGATPWDHRPLGTMALSQAYKSGVPWNETHFSDPEFDKALAEAGATFNVAERRAKMEKVEKILQDAAVMVQPFYRPIYGLASKKVRGYFLNPARQMQLTKIWMDA